MNRMQAITVMQVQWVYLQTHSHREYTIWLNRRKSILSHLLAVNFTFFILRVHTHAWHYRRITNTVLLTAAYASHIEKYYRIYEFWNLTIFSFVFAYARHRDDSSDIALTTASWSHNSNIKFCLLLFCSSWNILNTYHILVAYALIKLT